MKSLLRISYAAVVAVLASGSAVQAQLTLSADGPACTASSTTPSYSVCWGAFDGNDHAGDVVSFLDGVGVEASYVGKTEAGMSAGPFQTFAGASSGTLVFDAPFSGPFILSLKAATKFSLFYFDAPGSVASIDFSTAGVSVNPRGIPQGLSHASLFRVAVTAPEPGTLALLAMGLLGMAFVARRRTGIDMA